MKNGNDQRNKKTNIQHKDKNYKLDVGINVLRKTQSKAVDPL